MSVAPQSYPLLRFCLLLIFGIALLTFFVGQDWPAVAAGTTLFLIPILVFTVLLRKHLLRGITFGAVRK